MVAEKGSRLGGCFTSTVHINTCLDGEAWLSSKFMADSVATVVLEMRISNVHPLEVTISSSRGMSNVLPPNIPSPFPHHLTELTRDTCSWPNASPRSDILTFQWTPRKTQPRFPYSECHAITRVMIHAHTSPP